VKKGFRQGNAELVQQRLEAAVQLHRAGQLQEALRAYRAILQLEQDNFHALHLGGLVCIQLGDRPGGVTMLRAAIKIDPSLPTAHNNCGVALLDMGLADEARACFDRAISLQDDYFDAIVNRGNALRSLGRFGEATIAFNTALRLQPENLDALQSLGAALQGLQRHREAIEVFNAALKQRPGNAEVLNSRGVSLFHLRRFEEALTSFDAALAERGDFVEALSNRGTALQEVGRPLEALKSLDAAIRLRPDYHSAWSGRGAVLWNLGRHSEALESFDNAISLEPDDVGVLLNRGNAYLELGRLDKALADFDSAIEIDGDDAAAHWEKANMLLRYGDYSRGWREYEWRWGLKAGDSLPVRISPDKQWTGTQPVDGKTILLQAEQGVGDVLQFVRYVPALAKMGARVILQVPQQVGRLLRDLPGVWQISTTSSLPPPHDFSCPLMSLPLAFGTTLESIPYGDRPYLQAQPADVDRWLRRLAQVFGDSRRPRVGLVWSGGFRGGRTERWMVPERRNVPLGLFAGALDLAGIDFVSLQKGDPAESELRTREGEYWKAGRLLNAAGELNDFADTAGLIANLDLVISVDTSTAHLAAALGKPVWILNRYDTCWRWLLGREDSPWYGSVKLYRQGADRDWRPVLERVAADLRD
jgi:hypothetical protein